MNPEKLLMHKIVGISGRKESGKDTLAEYIADKLRKQKNHNYDVQIIHLADELKSFLNTFFGISYEQMSSHEGKESLTQLLWEDMPTNPDNKSGAMTCREVMEYVGTTLFRKMCAKCHINTVMSKIEKATRPTIFLIADVRAANEVTSIFMWGGFVFRLTRNPHNSNAEIERNLDPENYDWNLFDAVIDNEKMSLEEKNERGYQLFKELIEYEN